MCIKTQIYFQKCKWNSWNTENHIAVSSMIIPHCLYYPNFEKCFELVFKPRSSFENLLCSFFLRLQQNFETELTLPSLCTSVLPWPLSSKSLVTTALCNLLLSISLFTSMLPDAITQYPTQFIIHTLNHTLFLWHSGHSFSFSSTRSSLTSQLATVGELL